MSKSASNSTVDAPSRGDDIWVVWGDEEGVPSPDSEDGRFRRAGRAVVAWWSPIARRWTTPVELAVSAVLVLITSYFTLRMVRTAWTGPLWTDELFSLQHYSTQGFVFSITHYDSPNNHPLYNALTALVPGDAFAPWRARLLPIAAAGLAQVVILFEFGRRRLYLEGAVVYALFAVNLVWLDSILQARGYAFVTLATVVTVFAAWRYLEEPRRRWLFAIAGATLFGAWSQPTFVLFCGAFWAVFWLVTRRKDVFVFGAAAAASVLLAYLPILGPLKEAESTFGDQYGREFAEFTDAIDVFSHGLLNEQVTGVSFQPYLLFAALVAVLVLPPVTPLSSPQRRYVFVLGASSALFLTVCLYLQTPYFRAVAFVLLPVAVGGAILFSSWYRHRRAGPARPMVAVAVAGVLIANAWNQASVPMLPPLDDFPGAADFISSSLPDGTLVSYPKYPSFLTLALGPTFPVWLDPDLNSPALRNGRGVAVDYNPLEVPSVDFSAVAPLYAEARVRQRRGLYQRILVPRPPEPYVTRAEVDGSATAGEALLDDAVGTTLAGPVAGSGMRELTLQLDPFLPLRSLFLVTADGSPVGSVSGSVVGLDGQARALDLDAVDHIHSGVVVALGDRKLDAVTLVISAVGDGQPMTLSAVWAEPAQLPFSS